MRKRRTGIRALSLVALVALASPALAQSPTTNVFGIDFTANNSQGVSAAGHLRLRYNSATGALEQSIAGAAYTSVATSTGNWTFSGNIADLTGAGSIQVGNTTATSVTLKSNAAVTGANVIIDSVNLLTSAGAIVSIRNQGSQKGFFDGNGALFTANGTYDTITNTSMSFGGANATSLSFGNITNGTTGTFNVALAMAANKGISYAAGTGAFDASPASGTFKTSTGTNTLGGDVVIAANKNLSLTAGTGAVDFSPGSGTFKTNTGAHTFGSAAWGVTANLVVTGGSSATNTTAITFTPNVANGATSVAFKINNTTAIPTGFLMQVGDNSVSRFQMVDNSGDGFLIKDSGGSSSLSLSTTSGSVLAYSTATWSAGAGSISGTDGTGAIGMSAGTLTATVFSINPDADGTRSIGTSSIRWGGVFAVAMTTKAATNQTAATQSWRDSAGNAHYGIDSAGLPSLGTNFEYREPWMMNQTLSASQTNAVFTGGLWKYTTTANATGFTNTSSIATGSPVTSGLTIGSGTANTNSTIVQSIAAIFDPAQLTNLYAVTEFPMVLSAVGANNFTVKVGLSNAAISGAHPGGYYFQKASGDTNWQCITDDATTTSTTNSNVAPAAGTVQIGRIEYYGSGTVLAAKTVKFYINSTLVCTNTNNVYAAAGVSFMAYITATSAITQQSMTIGPTLLLYNEVATPLIP